MIPYLVYKDLRFEPDRYGELHSELPGSLKELADFVRDWKQSKRSFHQETSGSTGPPQMITITRDQMIRSAHRTLDLVKPDVSRPALLCLDAKYIAGKMMVVRAWEAGMPLYVTEPEADPLAISDFDEPAGLTAMVPYQLARILEDERSTDILNQMEYLLLGGAPITPQLYQQVQDLNVRVLQTFGMTETVSHIALRPLNGPDRSEFYTVLPGISILQDEEDCLIIEMEELDHPLVTRDAVRILSDSEFQWLGRADNVVNSGGVMLYPEEIEKQLSLGGILSTDFFLAGIPDPAFGEQLVLLIEGDDHEVEKMVQEWCESNLDPYHRPRKIFLVSEFDRTDTGKVRRKETLSRL